MFLKKIKAGTIVSLLISSVLLTGCATTRNLMNAGNRSSSDSTTAVTKSNTAKADFSEIEALASECIFNVNWFTQDGEYFSGTSFLIDSETHGEKIMVSAFHFLWPENADTFTGSELPAFVSGGELYNACTGDNTGASLKNCLIIEDADVVPATNKDVSAFTIQGGDNLKTLPLSTHKTKMGDTIYLLANLWDTEDIHENCVYEATVMAETDGVLYYYLDDKYGTSGASGAPIVNEYGEVVALHIGSSGSTCLGHSAESFLEQINNGTISDITYSGELSSSEEPASEAEEDIPTYTFSREEVPETTFFTLQLDAVTLADTLQSAAAPEGYQYVILDITLEGLSSELIDMYYSDFVLAWEDDYCYPLETGLSDSQLPDEYTISNSATTGQLIFYAPADASEVLFSYLDYYTYDDEDEIHYTAYYDMYIPLENWTR